MFYFVGFCVLFLTVVLIRLIKDHNKLEQYNTRKEHDHRFNKNNKDPNCLSNYRFKRNSNGNY